MLVVAFVCVDVCGCVCVRDAGWLHACVCVCVSVVECVAGRVVNCVRGCVSVCVRVCGFADVLVLCVCMFE